MIQKNIEESLIALEKELTEHICFEERELFNEVQKVANQSQLRVTSKELNDKDSFLENKEDEFWIRTKQ